VTGNDSHYGIKILTTTDSNLLIGKNKFAKGDPSEKTNLFFLRAWLKKFVKSATI
jgi:hypothetical protein